MRILHCDDDKGILLTHKSLLVDHDCVTVMDQLAKDDPLAAQMLQSIKLRQTQIEQGKSIEKIERRIEEFPQELDDKFDKALDRKTGFPEGYMRLEHIGPRYFKNTPKAKWKAYLDAIHHPKKSFIHQGDLGAIHSAAYVEDGLAQVARRFYRERKFIRETPKLKYYFHPYVGEIQERKEG